MEYSIQDLMIVLPPDRHRLHVKGIHWIGKFTFQFKNCDMKPGVHFCFMPTTALFTFPNVFTYCQKILIRILQLIE